MSVYDWAVILCGIVPLALLGLAFMVALIFEAIAGEAEAQLLLATFAIVALATGAAWGLINGGLQ